MHLNDTLAYFATTRSLSRADQLLISLLFIHLARVTIFNPSLCWNEVAKKMSKTTDKLGMHIDKGLLYCLFSFRSTRRVSWRHYSARKASARFPAVRD